MIFHIFGGTCSGKSTAIKLIKESVKTDNIAVWDIKENFYKEKNILKEDNTIDWDLWRKHEEEQGKELQEFIDKNKKKFILIESSGLNKQVNKVLRENRPVEPIFMGVPTPKETVKRCEDINADIQSGFDQNKKYATRYWEMSDLIPRALPKSVAVTEVLERMQHLERQKQKDENSTTN
jgi:adenylate kinase family enzyme